MALERILVVDDEPAIVQFMRERLERDGFPVEAAGSGSAALLAAREMAPDLILLDLMLPDMDGFEVLRQLRQGGDDTPVIILTARDDDVDVVVGLELGADDYVVKPFNPRELVARVRAVLRRRGEARALAERLAELEGGGRAAKVATTVEAAEVSLTLDRLARRAWFRGRPLDLRPREFDLLCFLSEHPGQVLTRTTLLDRVWGEAEYIDDRTVDVHIHRLRHKLAEIDPEAEPIQTERGVGYRWEP